MNQRTKTTIMWALYAALFLAVDPLATVAVVLIKGIACGLNNLQKLRDGEPLGGKSRAEDDFASDEEDDSSGVCDEDSSSF